MQAAGPDLAVHPRVRRGGPSLPALARTGRGRPGRGSCLLSDCRGSGQLRPCTLQAQHGWASGRRSWAAFFGARRRSSRLSSITGAGERSVCPAEESVGCRALQAPAPSRASESLTNPRESRLHRRPAAAAEGKGRGGRSVRTSLVRAERREGRGCLSPRRVPCQDSPAPVYSGRWPLPIPGAHAPPSPPFVPQTVS